MQLHLLSMHQVSLKAGREKQNKSAGHTQCELDEPESGHEAPRVHVRLLVYPVRQSDKTFTSLYRKQREESLKGKTALSPSYLGNTTDLDLWLVRKLHNQPISSKK